MKQIWELILQLIAGLAVGIVFAIVCGFLGSWILTVLDVQTVDVQVIVAAQPGFDVVEVPVQAIGLEEGFRAEFNPDRVIVTLSGPLPVLERLNLAEDILVTVDLTDHDSGNYQIEPQAEIVSNDVAAEELLDVLIESISPTLIDVEIGVDLSGEANNLR